MGAEQVNLVGSAQKAVNATVKYGPQNRSGDFAGKTVAQARAEMIQQGWKIPADAQAYHGKEKMADTAVIAPGQTIEFFKKLGEKGL